MATIVNARDLLLQATVPRLLPVLAPGNVTVPTSNVIGLPDYYSTAKQVSLRATSQVFRNLTVGGTTPSSIIITADLKNILGAITFSLVSGTVTFTTGSNTITINAGGMTSATAVFQASVTFNSVTYTDQITIINATEGSGVVNGYLTQQSNVVPVLANGTVLSYDNSGGTFSVYEGSVDRTGTAVTYSVVSTTSISVSIDPSGIYTISNMTANTGSATLRAVYGSTTVDRVYTVKKDQVAGFDGTNGSNGQRGTVNIAASTSGSSWSDSLANAALVAAGYGAPVERDVVTLYNLSVNYSETKVYTGGSWISIAAYINGNLLVTGTIVSAALATDSVTAIKIAANSITAAKIVAGTITADKLTVANLAAITATIGTLRTATTGGRTEISDNVIKVFDASNVRRVQIGDLSL